MFKQKKKPNRKSNRLIRLRNQELLEARLRKEYAEAAVRAQKDGFNDLYEEYSEQAEHHEKRWADFKAQADKLG